mmetsp:Transcript_20805/g.46332  ORF Transcript_20805/g.46332 Transcript_20805/m.46332 type:complete len:212 (+) Transcript_20805:264-899(+)
MKSSVSKRSSIPVAPPPFTEKPCPSSSVSSSSSSWLNSNSSFSAKCRPSFKTSSAEASWLSVEWLWKMCGGVGDPSGNALDPSLAGTAALAAGAATLEKGALTVAAAALVALAAALGPGRETVAGGGVRVDERLARRSVSRSQTTELRLLVEGVGALEMEDSALWLTSSARRDRICCSLASSVIPLIRLLPPVFSLACASSASISLRMLFG